MKIEHIKKLRPLVNGPLWQHLVEYLEHCEKELATDVRTGRLEDLPITKGELRFLFKMQHLQEKVNSHKDVE